MIPSTRLRPSSMPRFYVFAFSSSRCFRQGQQSTQLPNLWRMVSTRLVGSSLLTTVASGLFFAVAQGEGKISIIFPCAFRLRNNQQVASRCLWAECFRRLGHRSYKLESDPVRLAAIRRWSPQIRDVATTERECNSDWHQRWPREYELSLQFCVEFA